MKYNTIMRELRERHLFTQQQIADILHIDRRTYCDYELGDIRIPIESLIILAKHYNVDMNYICGLTNKYQVFPVQKSS